MNEKISAKDVMAYFGYKTSTEFMTEWRQLTDTDKVEIKQLTAMELGKEV